MFKIAYGAGHDLLEPGKQFEWHLNERVARYFAEAARQYRDVDLLRTDDPTGQTEVRLGERCRRANDYGADFALSIHHNAGANDTSAGGIMAFTHPQSSHKSILYRDAIYDACVDSTGLRGNRVSPKTTSNLYVLRNTDMPAVLMEYGFMDSTIDRAMIDTEEFARKAAYATMEGIAQIAGLSKLEQMPGYPTDHFIRDIQNIARISIDGKAGPQTLENTITISCRQNPDHPMVLPIQKRLQALGFYQGLLDGVAGVRFDSAIRQYQNSINAHADGEITKAQKTWQKLLGR